jgi:hypothetical protein
MKIEDMKLPQATPILCGEEASMFLKMMDENSDKVVGPVPTPKLQKVILSINKLKGMATIGHLSWNKCGECAESDGMQTCGKDIRTEIVGDRVYCLEFKGKE